MTALEALARARAAWEATQPQLFLDLWPDDGLNEPLRHPVGDWERRLVEPVKRVERTDRGAGTPPKGCGTGHPTSPTFVLGLSAEPVRESPALSAAGAGGLNPGPEPYGDLHRAASRLLVAVPPVSSPDRAGRGLYQTTGTDATPDREDRARPRR